MKALEPEQVVRPIASVACSPQELAERVLLEHFTPAYVVINADGKVLHASARTDEYLELVLGHRHATSSARQGLRLALRAAVQKAAQDGQATLQYRVNVGTNTDQRGHELIIRPIPSDSADALSIVVFQDIGGIPPQSGHGTGETADDETASLHQLEADLHAPGDRLKAFAEKLECPDDPLKSANAKIATIGQELLSAKKQSESPKKKRQPVDEDLHMMNAELKARVEELNRANNDIGHLLKSTQIATIILDRQFAIKSFTPSATDIFCLVKSDVGRSLSRVPTPLRLDEVLDDARRVLRTLATTERQVESAASLKRYLMRIVPDRTDEFSIIGVVMTFIDVTRITAAEAEIISVIRELRNRVTAVERILDSVPAGIFIVGNDLEQRVHVNRYGARLLGDEDDQLGPREVSRPYRLFEKERELPFWEQPLYRAAFTGKAVSVREGRLVRYNGGAVDVMMSAEPLFDEQGVPCGAIATFVDYRTTIRP